MSRKGRSTKKRAKKKQKHPIDWGGLWSGAARFGGWAMLLGAGGALALGAGELEERVGAARSDPLEARIDWPVSPGGERTWLPSSEQRRLASLLLTSVSMDPTDRDSLDAARRRLLSTGWFERDLTLVRRPGGVIELDGSWRAPAAVVRVEESAHVVSRDARRLPLTYPAGGAGPLRFIERVWGSPPGVGEVWTGGDVEAAIDLLAVLRGSPAWGRVAGIDASRYVRSQMLTVVTTTGARVVWGSAPGERPTGQVEHETRLARFEALMDDPAWIAAGRPRVELHLPRPVINESASP